MFTLVFISALFKLYHFWFVFGKTLNGMLPNLLYLSISLAELLLLALAFKQISNSKYRFSIAFSLNLFFGIIINGNYMYCRLFGIPLSLSLILFVSNIGDVGSSIFTLFEPFDLTLYSIDFLIITFLFFKKVRDRLNQTDHFFLSLSNKKIIGIIIIFISLWAFKVEPNGSWKEPFYRQDMESMLTFSPIGHTCLELCKAIYSYTFNSGANVPANIKIKLSEMLDYENDRYDASIISIPFLKDKIIAKPNIFIIQVESLMSDFMHKKIDGVTVLPNLNRLASKSVYLPNFYSHAIATSDSDFSTLTSLLPHKTKIAHLSYYNNDFQTLPKTLKFNGYYTFYSHSGPRTFWNTAAMNTNMGFDKQMYKEDLAPGENIGPWLSDADFFSQMLTQINKNSKPFFGMFITSSSHHPFNFANLPSFISTRGKKGNEFEIAQYANAIYYADNAIGRFITKLEESKLLDNSIVIIYGDHPMKLKYQSEKWEAKFKDFPDSEKPIHFFNSNVPCMIYAPKLLAPKIITKFCGQIDIGPTLLSICGIQKPKLFLGKSIFSDLPGFVSHKFFIGQTNKNFFYSRWWQKPGFKYCYDKATLKEASSTAEIQHIYNVCQGSEWILEYNFH